jgi:hypothetical protein
MSFTINLSQPVTIGGVTRCAFTVELPKADARSTKEKQQPAQQVAPSAKVKAAEK